MKFISIRISEGLNSRTIDFSEKSNLIYSERNTKGKTTLLRFLLYSLGFNIPNTRRIRFDNCLVDVVIYSENCQEITLQRYSENYITVSVNSMETTYVLPYQHNELLSRIFGTNNTDILDNMLGAFYVDQEKGWTLLNRGVAIGSIHFNIEALIRGLSGRDCSSLKERERVLSRELGKYRQIFSIAKYREMINEESGSVATESYEEEVEIEIAQLLIQQNQKTKELRRLDKNISDNKNFSDFIQNMKLLVKAPDGTIIPVTSDNIIGYEDTKEFLITKRKLTSIELGRIKGEIEALKRKNKEEEGQLSFLETESIAESFDRSLSRLTINTLAISKEIKKLETELSNVRREILYKTKTNNDVVTSLYGNIIKYAEELGIGNAETIASSYLFTSNLKELSGAILHKTVFAFRLAYIIEIEKALNIKLPIILDSPSGKEIDTQNVQLMINILKRDFSENQIIIASIYKYDLDDVKITKINNILIE